MYMIIKTIIDNLLANVYRTETSERSNSNNNEQNFVKKLKLSVGSWFDSNEYVLKDIPRLSLYLKRRKTNFFLGESIEFLVVNILHK